MKDLLIDALVDLYQSGPSNEYYGICYHVQNYIAGEGDVDQAIHDLMDCLFVRWPGFSGHMDYPVPGPEGQSPCRAFLRCPMWSGEYGSRRWALAEFMLRTLAHGAA